jgi:hypothetical protein
VTVQALHKTVVDSTVGSAEDILLIASFFSTAMPKGPALGEQRQLTWGNFTSVFEPRRVGEKDGPNFVPARFSLEPDGQVRRLKAHLLSRTAIALDIECNKETGEIPPALGEVVRRVKALGLAGLVYTSHNHKPVDDPRYRIVTPISEEIAHELPAPELLADRLQLLGVLDRSKIVASSVFYLPSSPPGWLDQHRTIIIPGLPIDAKWVAERAGALLAARKAVADRIASKAQSEAAARRTAKMAAGFNPDDSLIEKLRSRFDLDAVLRAHGYDKAGTKYRHPNSVSGSYGADIQTLGGIERVFSHNGTDPLHASNLPSWCDGVTAVDAFDVVAILNFGGERQIALRGLAQRFNLNKLIERRALARLLFRLVRQQTDQSEIEAVAYAEGDRLGLTRDDVCGVAAWVAGQAKKAA